VLLDKFRALYHHIWSVLLRSRKYAASPMPAELLTDPLIDAALRRAWYESCPHGPAVPWGEPGSRKQEQGGWIVWNKQTGTLRVVRVSPGKRDGLATILGTRPQGSDNEEVVAWFHTHPNTISEGYSPEPGPSDIAFTWQTARAPGLIETHKGRRTIPYPGP